MPAMPSARVDSSVELRLVVPGADAVSLPVTLRYSAKDPYAVQALFAGDDVAVEWVFGRDLLVDSLDRPSGEGDVQVWPAVRGGARLVMISLSSPDGQAVLEGDAADIEAFLSRTLAMVPAGSESTLLDLDGEIAALLAA